MLDLQDHLLLENTSTQKKAGSDRAGETQNWSYLWLGLAASFWLFSNGRWAIPLASWLSLIFTMRFIHSQRPLVGYLLSVLAVALVQFFAWLGIATVMLDGFYYLLFIVGYSALFLLPFLFDRLVYRRLPGWLATLSLPLACVSLEYLISLISPLGSWGSLAYSQAGNLPLLQLLSVTGLWGVSFLIGWCAGVVNWAWERGFQWQKVSFGLMVYLVILALVLLGGGMRLALTPPQSQTVKAASVTPSTTLHNQDAVLDERVANGTATATDLEAYRHISGLIQDELLANTARAAAGGAKIVFWAEGSADTLKEDEATLIARGQNVAQQYGIYLGMGLYAFDQSLIQTKPGTLKTVLVNPDGEIIWQYIKAKQVPGSDAATIIAGDGKLLTLDTPYGRLSSVICYDQDFPDLVRQAGQARVDFMFGPASDWEDVALLHAQQAAYRAIENGYNLLRPTKQGITLVVDYQGRPLASSNYFKNKADGVTFVDLPTKGSQTIYAWLGDVFAWVALGGLVTVIGLALRRKEWGKGTN